jgi:diguanylate cyclase (GGDEF)-like protein/PAS domain S-box-containing protein
MSWESSRKLFARSSALARRAAISQVTAAIHLVIAATVALSGLLIYESGSVGAPYEAIFVFAMLISCYYFPRRLAAAHLLWLLGVYALALLAVRSTSGFSPFALWLFTAIPLTVLSALTCELVAGRARVKEQAQSFFELSHDMLCIASQSGDVLELNSAWEQSLGYSEDELRACSLFERLHNADRERSEASLASLAEGGERIDFENRCRAKDGSWHWLRWSARMAAGGSLIYARATDLTELKQIASEREDLLVDVEILARDDPLTGLPNRRALDEQLPQDMARSQRRGSSLCLAIIDIDHFKAFNEAQGHLAGDALLRECAIAWDSKLRGEDTIVRYGGEQFLVVLQDCTLEQAAEIIGRLRAVTPGKQTCSGGVACWDFAETMDDLLERADEALYRAKREGRDRLVY